MPNEKPVVGEVVKDVTITCDCIKQLLSYVPDPVEAKKLEHVHWECKYPFRIILTTSKNPFDGNNFPSELKQGKHHVKRQVRGDAAPDKYPYTAEVDCPQTTGAPKKVRSHSPDIIIKNQ
jgi:hypothetical protein